MDQHLFEIAITAIIQKEDRYLLTKRALTKKRFPGKWTVPGGRISAEDYKDVPKDTANCWYNIIERTLRREVKEEVGLEVGAIRYLTSLIAEHPGVPCAFIVSCVGEYAGGEVLIQENELSETRWVTLAQAKEMSQSGELIGGIYDELVLAEDARLGKHVEWKLATD